MKQDKARINLVTIGHVDSGKSTFNKYLIDKCDTVDKGINAELDKESIQGKSAFTFVWIRDRLTSERQIDYTIDVSYRKLQTPKYKFTLFDVPGHRMFIKNMITGTSQADCAILMIASPQGEFEAGISINGQTREHALLAFALGVKQMIVCCNKMDFNAVNYSEERYHEIKKEVSLFLKKVGYKPDAIPFIPISSRKGDNIDVKSTNTPWYKGPTILEALELIAAPKKPIQKPLRIPLQNVYKISGIGTVAIGIVQAGVLTPKMGVTFAPSGMNSEVKSIQMHNSSICKAIPGDMVGFNVKNLSVRDLKRGYVCGETNNDPPREVESFLAKVLIINHPGQIKNGYTPIVHCHTAYVACRFSEIKSKIDRRTGDIIEKEPKFIKNGDMAMIILKPTKPMCVETYADYPTLGRFVVRDLQNTVAAGTIEAIYTKEQVLQK